MTASPEQQDKRNEFTAFLFLTVIIVPLLAMLVVAGYGFLVWIYQLFSGPPGPPAG